MTSLNHDQGQLLQDRYGLQVAARLSDAIDTLPYDISERLRAARVRALGARTLAFRQTVRSVSRSGGAAALTFGDEHLNWWDRVAAVLPLLALIFGLIVISAVASDRRASELAEIDAALLIDDLPPAAYADPGFSQFLKLSEGQSQ